MSHLRSYASIRPEQEDLPTRVNTLRRAGRLRRALEETLAPWDLTWADLDTLITLREVQPVGVRELHRHLTPKGESGIPNRFEALEEKGFLQKQPHPDDGRKKELTLTEKGTVALRQALLAVEQMEEEPETTPAPASATS